MNAKPTVDAFVHPWANVLSPEERVVLLECPQEVKTFCGQMLEQQRQEVFVTPLTEDQVPEYLQKLIPAWRSNQKFLKCPDSWPVAYHVREGWTFLRHAPRKGLCYKNWDHVLRWTFKNEVPTKNSIVFWVPRVLSWTFGMNVTDQLRNLAENRDVVMLPTHHMSSFGSASLLSALILSHEARTGERIPMKGKWVRTDTIRANGDRINIGSFDEKGLHLEACSSDECGSRDISCFKVGIEPIAA